MWSCMESTVRATKEPPAPSATSAALTGCSTEPPGVEGERVPTGEVGEYWPLVSP